MPRVYLLPTSKYSPEVIAVAFAKTSRSPKPFDRTAEELSAEQSAKFHEKWVIGYGHASVAEHAVVHVAVEGISRVAAEALESARLGSFTEKSSRYQRFTPEEVVIPPEIAGKAAEKAYREAVETLFGAYGRCVAAVREQVRRTEPPREGESEKRWDARIRSRYADVCRFLLPMGVRTNLGLTMNARLLAHTLRKMLSHPLAEVRQIAEQILSVAKEEVPTLLKYVGEVEGWQKGAEALRARAANFRGGGTYAEDWCHLVSWEPRGEERVLAAMLYRYGNRPYTDYLAYVRGLPREERKTIAQEVLGVLGERDVPPRELEYTAYTFDIVIDQGGYYEFKRHRMMTQTPQALGVGLGYAVPRLAVEAGLEGEYRAAMDAAARAYEAIAEVSADAAAYVVPNAFKRRVLAVLNLREAFHFLRLRAAPNAHFSMRRLAYRMAEEIAAVHPTLAAFLNLPAGSWEAVEKDHFAAV